MQKISYKNNVACLIVGYLKEINMNYCNVEDVVCVQKNEFGYSICCYECKEKKCSSRCETLKSDYRKCGYIINVDDFNKNITFRLEEEIKEKLDLIHITNKEIDELQVKINRLK